MSTVCVQHNYPLDNMPKKQMNIKYIHLASVSIFYKLIPILLENHVIKRFPKNEIKSFLDTKYGDLSDKTSVIAINWL